jgi:pimeloyl-ACP methyl ester carboxylesterase
MMRPRAHRVAGAGVMLAAFEWNPHARGGGDTIVLAHATGFHARCWDQVVARLGDRHVVAIDQRGHGRSDGPLPVHWSQFGEDLAAALRALDLHAVVGVGHSMGGHAMTEAAALEPARLRSCVRSSRAPTGRSPTSASRRRGPRWPPPSRTDGTAISPTRRTSCPWRILRSRHG